MDENLKWLTQNTEDPKSNKGNLTFPTHTVNVIELKSSKEVVTLDLYINTSACQVYHPLSPPPPSFPPPLSFNGKNNHLLLPLLAHQDIQIIL